MESLEIDLLEKPRPRETQRHIALEVFFSLSFWCQATISPVKGGDGSQRLDSRGEKLKPE